MVWSPAQEPSHAITFISRVAKEQSTFSFVGGGNGGDDVVCNRLLKLARISLDWDHFLRNFRTVGASSKYLINFPAEFLKEVCLKIIRARRCHENDGDRKRSKECQHPHTGSE